MDFRLTQEYHRKPLETGFYVDIQLMGGDGDTYDKICIGRFDEKDFDVMRNLVGTLEEMKKIPSGYEEKYNQIEDFKVWFCELGGVDKKDFRFKFFKNQFALSSYTSNSCYGWSTESGGYNYKLVNYSVFFVSSFGEQYKVNVEK